MADDDDYYLAFTNPAAMYTTGNAEYFARNGYPVTDEHGNFITYDTRGVPDKNQYIRYRDQRDRFENFDGRRNRWLADAELNSAASAIATTGGGILAQGQPGSIYRVVNGQRQLEIIDEPADYHVGSQNLDEERAFHDTHYVNNMVMHYPQRFKKSEEFKRREKEYKSKPFGAPMSWHPLSQNTQQFGFN